jgi:KaiC/GvpD/RAD55 family RecA-like ATPase
LNYDTTAEKRDRGALEALLRDHGAVFHGKECRCPFHDDKTPSAGIFQDNDGFWRFKCQTTSCGVTGDIFDIEARIKGKTVADVLRERREAANVNNQPIGKEPPKVYATIQEMEEAVNLTAPAGRWEYVNPDTGDIELIVYRVERDGKKSFRQASPRPLGWTLQTNDGPRPLYNRAGIATKAVVLFVEGEKAADMGIAAGVPCTTLPGGAETSKNPNIDYSPLKGKTVYLWPDNDIADGDKQPAGIAHMQRVAASLEALGIDTRMVDIGALNLPPKGDLEQFLQRIDGDAPTKKRAVWEAMQNCTSNGMHHKFVESIKGIQRSAPLRWKRLNELTKFATPGMVSILVGEPGSGKSFFLIECALYWHELDVPFAFYALEDEREFHIRRALAQKTGISKLSDVDWVIDNEKVVEDIAEANKDFLNKFGAKLAGETSEEITKNALMDWIVNRVNNGAKIIVVDPITMTKNETNKCWIEDQKLMGDVKRIARERKVSIILATHPSKILNRAQPPSLDDIAGGAAVSRFAHKVIWLQNHVIPITSTVKSYDINMEMEHNRTVHILKSRDTPGQGMKIAMTFEPDLRFHEKGVILSGPQDVKRGKRSPAPQSEFTKRAIVCARTTKPVEVDIHERYEEDDLAF